MKKRYKILIGFLVFVILVNLGGFLYNEIEWDNPYSLRDGIIVKFRDRVYVFAHGMVDYVVTDEQPYTEHISWVGNSWVSTVDLLDELREQGAKHIWLSQCHTGDHIWIRNYVEGDNEDILWEDYPEVSRNEKQGATIPVFYGFGIVRFSSND